ncbi:MAG: nucleoside-diphosphate kinase [Sphingobacterium sp.]|nr:nucleoside-diphosphate kinase [Sphingobacterium sp.]
MRPVSTFSSSAPWPTRTRSDRASSSSGRHSGASRSSGRLRTGLTPRRKTRNIGGEFAPKERPMERTLAIIKPDATKKRIIGKIIDAHRGGGLHDRQHAARPPDQGRGQGLLPSSTRRRASSTACASSCPRGRSCSWSSRPRTPSSAGARLMGATDPAQAKPGTLRHTYGFSIERNAIHGSDARDTAEFEIGYFFKK